MGDYCANLLVTDIANNLLSVMGLDTRTEIPQSQVQRMQKKRMMRFVEGVVIETQVDGFSVIAAVQVGGTKNVLVSEPEITGGPDRGPAQDVLPLPSPHLTSPHLHSPLNPSEVDVNGVREVGEVVEHKSSRIRIRLQSL